MYQLSTPCRSFSERLVLKDEMEPRGRDFWQMSLGNSWWFVTVETHRVALREAGCSGS